MDSRELGLLLAHQLFGLEDLHFGLWGDGVAPTVGNLVQAQQRYTDYLLDRLPPPPARVLDVGAGTGHLLGQLLARGYQADAVSPSATLGGIIQRRLADLAQAEARLFRCRFEHLPVSGLERRYDAVVFAESFQFVKIHHAFDKLAAILKPGGVFIICDVFSRTAQARQFIRGGHTLEKFQRLLAGRPFERVSDEDITRRVAPTIALMDELLSQRLRPAAGSIAAFVRGNYPVSGTLLGWLFRKRLRAIRGRYLAGAYTRARFEQEKTYRLLVYRLVGPGDAG